MDQFIHFWKSTQLLWKQALDSRVVDQSDPIMQWNPQQAMMMYTQRTCGDSFTQIPPVVSQLLILVPKSWCSCYDIMPRILSLPPCRLSISSQISFQRESQLSSKQGRLTASQRRIPNGKSRLEKREMLTPNGRPLNYPIRETLILTTDLPNGSIHTKERKVILAKAFLAAQQCSHLVPLQLNILSSSDKQGRVFYTQRTPIEWEHCPSHL